MTLDSIREFAEYILDDAAFKVSFVQRQKRIAIYHVKKLVKDSQQF